MKRLISILLLATSLLLQAEEEKPLRICATTPDLADIAQSIAGKDAKVSSFVKGPQNPHFIQAKPSFTVELRQADLLILNGLELEAGWLPVLQENCRNPKVQNGKPGCLDASSLVDVKQDSKAGITRKGHVHGAGNPHYLLDPVNGLRVAAGLRQRLAELRPAQKDAFDANFKTWRHEILAAMVGEKLCAARGDEGVAALLIAGKDEELRRDPAAGGWIASLAPAQGASLLVDHDFYIYLTERFGLKVVDTLESEPGVPPSTAHLKKLIDTYQGGKAKALLAGPYFPEKIIRLVHDKAGIPAVPMCHQCGGLADCDSYLKSLRHNLDGLAKALAK
ncbi:MAG: hypothetical protein RL095_2040 [Verrucomicrobiota bacterium]|jgi:ABC-type Zn uptake system ZnuABC Zn-binding protein ZnuA